jgi:hypothetical protein
MPVEIIGEFGTPRAHRKSVSAQATLAIRHIIETCGPPPPGMELDVQWQEHELGSYPLIVLTWDDAMMRGAPGKYLEKCQAALFEFENGEASPNSDLFELLRDLNELNEHAVRASMRARRQPKS